MQENTQEDRYVISDKSHYTVEWFAGRNYEIILYKKVPHKKSSEKVVIRGIASREYAEKYVKELKAAKKITKAEIVDLCCS